MAQPTANGHASAEPSSEGVMSPDPLDQPPWVRKFFGYLPGWRVSLLSFYSTVVFKAITLLVIRTGFDRLLDGPVNYAATVVAASLAWAFGSKGAFRLISSSKDRGVLMDTTPISMINCTDPDFTPVFSSKSFPNVTLKDDGYGFNESSCHMLALCMKVAYESTIVIRDVVRNDWGWSFDRAIWTDEAIPKDNRFATKYVPQTRAFIVSNAQAVVLVFRGTEPLNLVEWFSDGDADFVRRKEVYGQVHRGFYEAFFYSDTQPCIFDQIVEELLLDKYRNKALFVTGHSLGGALVSVFSHALAKRAGIATALTLDKRLEYQDAPLGHYHGQVPPELSLYHNIIQGGGVYTFAGPRVGDLPFVAYNGNCYQGKIFRIVHSADLVPKVPPIDLEYRHHFKEYYLNTFGYLLEDPEDIEKWRAREGTGLNFVLLYIYKTVAGLFYYKENFLRTLERVLFFFLAPGLTDHWPCDYERKLRNVALNVQSTGAGVKNPGKPANAARRRPKIVLASTAMRPAG